MERKGHLMKERTVETAVASLQWFIFLLANSIVLPIVVGQVYHLSVDQIAELLQRTFWLLAYLPCFPAGLVTDCRLPMGRREFGLASSC